MRVWTLSNDTYHSMDRRCCANALFLPMTGHSVAPDEWPIMAGLRQSQGKSACRTTAIQQGRMGSPLAELDDDLDRPLMAGPRPIAARPGCSHFGLFSHLERVVDLNAEIPDRTLQFCMAEQELYRPKVLCTAVN